MADDDDVIDLAERRAAAPAPAGDPPAGLRREPMTSTVGHCKHPHARIDEAERKAWCKACGVELDVWAVIATLADRYEQGWKLRDWIAGLRAERSELEAEVKSLKSERARLRAELKSLGGRVRERKAATAPNVVKLRGNPGG